MRKPCTTRQVSKRIDIQTSNTDTYIHTYMHTYIHTYMHTYLVVGLSSDVHGEGVLDTERLDEVTKLLAALKL